MPFTPIEKMMERVENNGDSDFELFHELLYAGEFATKITGLALVASIEDNRENHHYRFLHKLVRADGVGNWATTIDEICTGPAISTALTDNFRTVFARRVGSGNWQYEAVHGLQEVLAGLDSDAESMGRKVNLCAWFKKFTELRNKTRGHGAITPASCARLVPNLRNSIRLLIANNPMFQRPWAYLHQNLSGTYSVIGLGGDTSCFSELETAEAMHGENYPDGVYLWVEKPRLVSLLHSDIDATDFFVPNGAFNGNTYELHSPITDNRRREDAQSYLAIPSDRPVSETEGTGELYPLGNVLTNLPDVPRGYVKRPILEQEIRDELINDRHPIVTLVGRGGIGKTSLALTILHEIAKTDRYDMIVWFSARDIDLTPTGPKIVQPRTLTGREIVEEYKHLVAEFEPDPSIEQDMRGSISSSRLFVFDNFETVSNPIDLYQWIDTNIRSPSKAVITSRFRDFKADFPIKVSGMENAEAEELIQRTARELNIEGRVGTRETKRIVEGSDGHPYVIKIMLGEMADKGALPSKPLARKDDILDALFERTYNNLSPLANRIFLTLSGWRSLVPQLAVEAVLHWRSSESESVNPEAAVDELVRMSLIERTAAQDGIDFLRVPITAALFGHKKLEVSQHHELIRYDIQFLQNIVPSTKITDLKMDSYPRIRSVFKKIAIQVGGGSASMEDVRPMLEFIAKNYSPAWLLFADLEKEVRSEPEREVSCVQRFLEQSPQGDEARKAWLRLVRLYRMMGNTIGSCSAFLNAAEIRKPDLEEVSSMAFYANREVTSMDATERIELCVHLKPLAKLMEPHRQSASATDLSRLAWLYLHLGEEEISLRTAMEGLRAEPDNVYCQRLVDRLI